MRIIIADALILRALLNHQLCGAQIAAYVQQASNSTALLTPGSLYPALRRLWGNGMIRTVGEEFRDRCEGRPSRLYVLTDEGSAQGLRNWLTIMGIWGFDACRDTSAREAPFKAAALDDMRHAAHRVTKILEDLGFVAPEAQHEHITIARKILENALAKCEPPEDQP